MKRLTISLLATLGLMTGATGPVARAAADYNDVGVIVNVNSSTSQTIGSYFAQQRGIPAANIIYVNAPVTRRDHRRGIPDPSAPRWNPICRRTISSTPSTIS